MRLRYLLTIGSRLGAPLLIALATGSQARAAADPGLLPADESPCLPVQRLTLEGASASQFEWALEAAHRADDGRADPAAPRCLGPQAIAGITHRVQGALIARGYVTTRVLVPAQDLRTGTLVLAILPGRLAGIHLQRDALGRGTALNALPAQAGQLLNLRDIEQALENFQRVPTVQADIQIAPSEPSPQRPEVRPGDSDLLIRWTQRLPFRLGLSLDDSGTRAAGRHQGAITLSYDNALNLNDLFYVTVHGSLRGGLAGEGGAPAGHSTQGHALHYSLPWGRWLLALNASWQEYRQVVAGATQNYVYRGQTRQRDLRLQQAVHRDAVSKTHLSLRGWSRQSTSFIDDTEIEVQKRRTAGWELGAQHQRTVGTAALSLGVAYRRGTGAWQALSAPEDAFGEGASRPHVLNADLNGAVPLGQGVSRVRYAMSANAQWTRQALVPQDRFAIGGRYTVRGFDGESALSAARGWWVRQELQSALGDSGQTLYLGLDHGEVGGPASETLAGTRLTGAVIGLRGSLRNASWDFFAGRPVKKPDLFRTASRTAGFSLHVSF